MKPPIRHFFVMERSVILRQRYGMISVRKSMIFVMIGISMKSTEPR